MQYTVYSIPVSILVPVIQFQDTFYKSCSLLLKKIIIKRLITTFKLPVCSISFSTKYHIFYKFIYHKWKFSIFFVVKKVCTAKHQVSVILFYRNTLHILLSLSQKWWKFNLNILQKTDVTCVLVHMNIRVHLSCYVIMICSTALNTL